MNKLISILLLAWATVAFGDASPYCWPDVSFSASPTRSEQKRCKKWMLRLGRYCERNPGASLCVTGITNVACATYIPSYSDCEAGHYVCSGMPGVPGSLEDGYRCYFGGGDVGVEVPARTDVLPIPPPTCKATFPLIRPKTHELRRCIRGLEWFRNKLCTESRNSGLAPCVTRIGEASCLPYNPSDSDCIAGHYVCAAEASAGRCHF